MRIAVTGSAGFIGAALAANLRAADHTVLGIDIAEGADLRADICQADRWAGRLAGCDALVHAAALVGMPADTDGFWRVNVEGTRSVLGAVGRAGVPRVVLLSSVTVYGNRFPDEVTEEHPVASTGVAYPDSKIRAEQMALEANAAGLMECVIVRPGDVYGPRSLPWTVNPVRLIRSRRVAVPGHSGVLSPIYIDDLVRGLAAAALTPGAAGHIVNLSGGRGAGTGEFFDRYAVMMGRSGVPRIPRSAALAVATAQSVVGRATGTDVQVSSDAVRYLADRRGTYGIAKAAQILHWRPAIGLDEGMERTERWLRDSGMLPDRFQ